MLAPMCGKMDGETEMRAMFLVIAAVACSLGGAAATAADIDAFEWSVKQALAPLAGKAVSDVKVVYLSADVQSWVDTGLTLKAGDRYTLLMDGTSWISRSRKVLLPTHSYVSSRVGEDGAAVRNVRDTNTIEAPRDGQLYLQHSSVRFLDTGPGPNLDAGGGVAVAVISWSAGADIPAVLARLAQGKNAPEWAAAELARLKNPPAYPEGWAFPIGPSEAFQEVEVKGDGGPARRMQLHMTGGGGLLTKAADRPLTPQTRLAWKWRMDSLPSKAAEDTIWTHDYVSIAVEFDNGRDLTYYWSAALPREDSFQCPFPGWVNRETHLVVRSGKADLGKWLAEERNVFEDYQKAVGGPMPKRIVNVWLLGVGFVSRLETDAAFGDIRLSDDTGTLQVF